MKQGIRALLHYFYDNPLVSHKQLVVATQKNDCKLSETKDVRSKAAELETREVIVCHLP